MSTTRLHGLVIYNMSVGGVRAHIQTGTWYTPGVPQLSPQPLEGGVLVQVRDGLDALRALAEDLADADHTCDLDETRYHPRAQYTVTVSNGEPFEVSATNRPSAEASAQFAARTSYLGRVLSVVGPAAS